MAMPASGGADSDVCATIRAASELARTSAHGPVWLALREHDDLMARAERLQRSATGGSEFPLYGLAFAVKDNIDVAGLPTTAGCPAFAYTPRESALVVERLERAGAVCIGKTHLDQFATGLVGTRSPRGPVPNPFNAGYVCGGSSSGSAVAVALGQVTFALGTDTAGSGRIPAAFNNLIGIKPTRGLLSTRGVVPACRSLDCVAILARDLATAWKALQVAAWHDEDDLCARKVRQRPVFGPLVRLGLPAPLEFFGDALAQAQFAAVVAQWRDLGAEIIEVPLAPFREVSDLLYEGPWIAERDAAIGAFLNAHPDDCDPTVRAIVAGAAHFSATDAFRAHDRLRELSAQLAPMWRCVDALLAPTAPTIPTLAAVAREPVVANAQLGLYVNFVNLLDLAAIAVPAGFRGDGLPAGFSLIAPAGSDHALAELAYRYLLQHSNRVGVGGTIAPTGAPPQPLPDDRDWVRLAVAGAHMRGMPLNGELLAQEARFVDAARTAPRYRLHALPGPIPKPGLVRVTCGASIGIELWDVPDDRFGRLVAKIPAPMAIGNVELETGTWVKGFVCEPIALVEAIDITSYGDWRTYVDSRRPGLAAVK
ncbi:MAG TPA: allophanate hydrolase [Casimicrobiaceae bacterium]|jgi:allophanate hydrolase|nr:allophanate hydrolase [Casimicrobiaceae bacterium]